jgi:ribose-phosphate pyrophosphokinase
MFKFSQRSYIEMAEALSAEQAEKTILFSGEVHADLGSRIAERMGIHFGDVQLGRFDSTDPRVFYKENVRGRDVILFQPHAPSGEMSVSDAVHQHLEMIYAAENNNAGKKIAVAPVIAGARQDRMAQRGEGVSVALTLTLLQAAGATELVTTDMHSIQSLPVFRPHPTHLTALQVLAKEIRKDIGTTGENVFVASADPGRYSMAKYMGKVLGLPSLILDKQRAAGMVTRQTKRIDGIEDWTAVLVDDMIGGGGTFRTAGEILTDSKVSRIIAAATHPWLSKNAVQVLSDSAINKIITTDTIPVEPEKIDAFNKDKDTDFTIVSTADMHAYALTQMLMGGSVSEDFQGLNWS